MRDLQPDRRQKRHIEHAQHILRGQAESEPARKARGCPNALIALQRAPAARSGKCWPEPRPWDASSASAPAIRSLPRNPAPMPRPANSPEKAYRPARPAIRLRRRSARTMIACNRAEGCDDSESARAGIHCGGSAYAQSASARPAAATYWSNAAPGKARASGDWLCAVSPSFTRKAPSAASISVNATAATAATRARWPRTVPGKRPPKQCHDREERKPAGDAMRELDHRIDSRRVLHHRAVAERPMVAASGARARGAHQPAPQNHGNEISQHAPRKSPQGLRRKTMSLRWCGCNRHR